jgi:hypothetical protein
LVVEKGDWKSFPEPKLFAKSRKLLAPARGVPKKLKYWLIFALAGFKGLKHGRLKAELLPL